MARSKTHNLVLLTDFKEIDEMSDKEFIRMILRMIRWTRDYWWPTWGSQPVIWIGQSDKLWKEIKQKSWKWTSHTKYADESFKHRPTQKKPLNLMRGVLKYTHFFKRKGR